jgi:phosphate:Na+ symporter
MAILVGIIASILLQSSSVVSGIILVLAGAGQIDLAQSVGLILGANIGTTSTVIIASLTMGKEAKKVAMSHFLFNFIGVILLLPFLGYFYKAVQWLDGDTIHQVSNIHLIFNLVCATLFLIVVRPFSRLVNFIIK